MNAYVSDTAAVTLRDLSRSFKGKTVLERISLDIPHGQFVSLLGESGSGKTTLGLALTRLISSKGRIAFVGQDIAGHSFGS